MPDPLDSAVRSRFQRQRRRDTAAEMRLRSALHAAGHRYRVDHRLEPSLRVRGDIVFTKLKVVVFVDGCFWHGCPLHSTAPKNNAEWWREKLAANVARDERNRAALRALGWVVVQVWEHETLEEAMGRVCAVLENR